MLTLDEEKTSPTVIKVVGIGGGGMNAVNRMVAAEMKGVEFIVVNTDEQVLKKSKVEEKIAIGQKTTRGMGAGGDPDIGLKAAMEDRERIHAALKDADMVFVTAGMGGGTGTGAAPVIAEVARELGALTVGVVTMPFTFEGGKRYEQASRGLSNLREKVDALITIKNDSIFKVVDQNTQIDVAFRMVDDILLNAVKGLSDLINRPGLVNVDFADVRAVMAETGDAIMGAGEGVGEKRVADVVNMAIHNALLEDSGIEGATGLLINICGGHDLTMGEWREVTQAITDHVDSNAKVIVGLTLDELLHDKMRVTVIATGLHKKKEAKGPDGRMIGRPVRSPIEAGRPAAHSIPSARQHVTPRAEIIEEPGDFMEVEAAPSETDPRQIKVEPISRTIDPGRYPDGNDDLEIPTFLRKRRQA
ncbi:MAG: cell division protein FtsZ [Spirochaetia bacterium]|nr:cell division protein FtsZ [Spirochaetia bacterium]